MWNRTWDFGNGQYIWEMTSINGSRIYYVGNGLRI